MLDGEGTIHQEGVMRPVTGWDELYRERDVRVIDNPAYGILVIRKSDNLWVPQIYRAGDTLEFASMGLTCAIAILYENIEQLL